MSKLLEVNDNILREARFTLTIFNGEDAEVFVNGEPNMDLNTADYWSQFLKTVDSTTIPLLGISSITKTQDIWYRNASLVDSCVVDLSIDKRDNIIEFINKGVKNKYVDFSKLDQLVFVLKISFINSVGRVTTKELLTDRGEISTNTDAKQQIKLTAMSELLSEATSDHLVQGNTASRYNFINLQSAFEAICNSPHRIEDEYNYPITPFIVDTDTYIPIVEDAIEITEQNILSGYEVYAEEPVLDTVKDPNKPHNEIDVFFYGSTPQCGWIEKKFTSNGSLESQNTEWVNNWTFFTNQDDIEDYNNTNLTPGENTNIQDSYKSVFRMFRPFKKVIADTNIFGVVLGSLIINETYQELPYGLNGIRGFRVGIKPIPSFDDSAYKIDIGDELIYCEQLMDFEYEAPIDFEGLVNQRLTKNILFNSTANIYIYNKTKDVFYWKVMSKSVITTPLNYRWLDMSSYTGVATRYDCQLENDNDSEPDKTLLTFNTRLGYERIFFGSILPNRDRRYHIMENKQYTVGLYSMVGWKYTGAVQDADNDANWTLRVPESNYEEMKTFLQEQTAKVKPKTIKFDDVGSIYYLYNYTEAESFNIISDKTKVIFSFCKKTSPLLDDGIYSSREKVELDEGGIYWNAYEITNSLGRESVVYRYLQSNTEIEQRECRFVESPTRSNRILENTSIGERGLNNVYSYSNITYVIFKNNIYSKSDSSSPFQTLNTIATGDEILDVNVEIDRMIFVNNAVNPAKITYSQRLNTPIPIYNTQPNANGINFLYSMDRVFPNFTDPTQTTQYYSFTDQDNEPIRLLDLKGTRKQALRSTAKSFFKNCYSAPNGVLQIKNPATTAITFDDSMMVVGSFESKDYTYSRLEWTKHSVKKQGFIDISNEDVTSKEQEQTEYDESFSVNAWTDIDAAMNFTIKRTATNLEWRVVNTFGTAFGIEPVPPSWLSFHIDLTGIFLGIKLNFDFINTELQLDKSFSGELERGELRTTGIKDELVDLNGVKLWKEDQNISMKFPLLYNKDASSFSAFMSNWFVYAGRIRKNTIVSFVVPQLILFNENWGDFNIGEQRIIVDSETKYLNGYDLEDGTPVPFNNNKASFYIEKMVLNFKDRTTKFTLIGV
jgi:hypothetical protein